MDHVSTEKRERRTYQQEEYLAAFLERRGDPFEVIEANTPTLKNIFSQIRYKIYCEEHTEFALSGDINHTEQDEYDDHSRIFLLLLKPLHMFVGGVRIILPRPDLPFYGLPAISAENSAFQKDFPHDLGKMIEISRTIVDKKRLDSVKHLWSGFQEPKALHPPAYLHLIKWAFQVCLEQDYKGIIAYLDPSIFRRIRLLLGGTLHPYGDLIEYHGKRQGGYYLRDEALDGIKKNNQRIYNFIVSKE